MANWSMSSWNKLNFETRLALSVNKDGYTVIDEKCYLVLDTVELSHQNKEGETEKCYININRPYSPIYRDFHLNFVYLFPVIGQHNDVYAMRMSDHAYEKVIDGRELLAPSDLVLDFLAHPTKEKIQLYIGKYQSFSPELILDKYRNTVL